ncbi:MAG: DNA glycosylase AlkZ-like family protein, partial [Candidatus Limnocylindria bacterium]
MVERITWPQALAWRMRRHLLDPIGTETVEGVVRRLGGVQAQVASSAELAIRLRRQRSVAGEVARALAGGRVIKTWAMRGALHLLTPEEGGDVLAILAAGRGWEKPSWDRYFDMTPRRWGLLQDAVRDALADGPLTRQELGAVVAVGPQLGHLLEHFDSSWGTILKPLAFQGDLSIGPMR